MWRMQVPMLCLKNIEWNPVDRAIQQFEKIQHIPEAPEWQPDHAKHDDRSPVDLEIILDHKHYVDMWINWQPRVVKAHDYAILNAYLEWSHLRCAEGVGKDVDVDDDGDVDMVRQLCIEDDVDVFMVSSYMRE
ncbi:hypothetical protein CQW23_21562 [Capsicum baccatum]|uniref:Uncharacterized protein n=1 Tax=Capsicum baccatum TaxID=33114 RepID=A0A2G2VYF2_CAPBA|nr:hypothetical protein CQW23_21562 [Capsicum baccatum]